MEMINRLCRISASVCFALLTLITAVIITVMASYWQGVLLFLFGH